MTGTGNIISDLNCLARREPDLFDNSPTLRRLPLPDKTSSMLTQAGMTAWVELSGQPAMTRRSAIPRKSGVGRRTNEYFLAEKNHCDESTQATQAAGRKGEHPCS
jgi:hypothetical protein